MLREHVAKDPEAPLGLGVRRRSADEGEAPVAVLLHQMEHQLAHPRGVVDEHAGHARERHRDAADGQRTRAPAEARQLAGADRAGQRARHDEEAIDVLGPGQIVDGVALARARARSTPPVKHTDRRRARAAAPATPDTTVALEAVLQPVDEETDHGPIRRPRVSAFPSHSAASTQGRSSERRLPKRRAPGKILAARRTLQRTAQRRSARRARTSASRESGGRRASAPGRVSPRTRSRAFGDTRGCPETGVRISSSGALEIARSQSSLTRTGGAISIPRH